MTDTPAAEHLDELLAMLESAGSGLALLELAETVALVAPEAAGVSTFLPLMGAMYILREGQAPCRVQAGELALVPTGIRVRLAARRVPGTTIDSHDRLRQRGRWIEVPVAVGEEVVARVAAARIIGSRVAALQDLVVTPVKDCAVAGQLFRQLVDEVDRGPEAHAGFATALMNACVVHAIRRDLAAKPAATTTQSARGALARAITLMRARPGDNHSIDSLAHLSGMSRSSFVRAFARATGDAPQRYLQLLRLREAAALLGSTTLPVKSIAARMGFASRSHFSRAFRSAYTLDPSAYRRVSDIESVPVQSRSVPERASDGQVHDDRVSSLSPNSHGNAPSLRPGNGGGRHQTHGTGTSGDPEQAKP